jgi:dextranase
VELIPGRSHNRPGSEVTIELSVPAAVDGAIVVTKLHEVIRTVPVANGATRVHLGGFDRGGYGVRLGEHRTAFDVLESPFERPRYGFVVTLSDDADIEAVSRNFRRLHLNLAQFYDWGYRHSQLMPPEDHYVDPLGQERDLQVVNRMARSLEDAGTVPLGYSAVYAIGSSEVAQWPDSLLLRADGEPYRLGEDFLVLVDPAEPRWLEHYLGRLEQVIAGSALRGFHLDQYGWPKFAIRSDGARIDLAESFVTLLAAVREHLPAASFMFNNVNDFPTWATAASPQDATYIEVWEPHSTLQDLATLAVNARAARPEHPPILSAYLSCYDEDESRANNAAALVMATAFSHGASHLLLGESGNVLTDPYYPRNHRVRAESLDFFARWYDFGVRYGDLLFDPAAQDVTESFTGGINEDVVFESAGPNGAEFSTKAIPGTIWTRVVRTPLGLVIHLVNLVGQTETVWDAGKGDPVRQGGVTVTLAMVGTDARLHFATVDSPDLIELTAGGTAAGRQENSLSAGQAGVSFSLPKFGEWALLFLPAAEFA